MRKTIQGKVYTTRGFTLIEIAAVLAVLAILVSLVAGGIFSYRSKMHLNRAAADLQVIQQGLEGYRARFGDYPRLPDDLDFAGVPVSSAKAYLLNALCGKIGPARQAVSGIPSMLNTSLLQYEKTGLPMSGVLDNWIVDPWGNPYQYDYRPQLGTGEGKWPDFGYKLRSNGPDGTANTEDDIVAQ